MSKSIRFVLTLHNHQPIGNFDHVFEEAYQDSYLPFLDVFEPYEALRIGLHTSGSLMEWLDVHHPEYVDRLAKLVQQGRIEIVGGAFFEPILAMIPSRDRVGQICNYTRWLEDRIGCSVRGMWVPERVWEQSYVRDLNAAGMEYTILDDFHFKASGLVDEQLHGHYLTEDDGRTMSIFPGSERLRYLVPFGQPHETIDYLRHLAEHHEDPVVLFGDDGEKFGTWPDTKDHCYRDRWLHRFFDALSENQDWIHMTTPSEAIDNVQPLGKVYLPTCSYREMTEWALPADMQNEYYDTAHDMKHDDRWGSLQRFVRGGYWRNFKIRYPETDDMYSRMMQVSARLQRAIDDGKVGPEIEDARCELYRGQCNCSYWHGAFGGVYLPHLRNAVYKHLIKAENLLDRIVGRSGKWIEAKAEDLNFDGRQEVQVANDKMIGLIAPALGGHLYELDVRSIEHNLLATMTRGPEAYHRKILAGANQGDDDCASIHDRVVFKQEGLDQLVQHDTYRRKCLVDLFFDADVSLDQVSAGKATQHGDFVEGVYDARVRRNPDRVQVQLTREGNVDDVPVHLTKAITLSAGSSILEIAYRLENLPQDRSFHFGVEMNFAGLPSGADDRYFCDPAGNGLGQLDSRLDLHETESLGLTDEWLGIDVGLKCSRPTSFWTYPIESVSGSEGGYELVHQSVAVIPHWQIQPEADGSWSVTIHLSADTAKAESRQQEKATAAVTT
jgi:4-alpha-glucanotransferase